MRLAFGAFSACVVSCALSSTAFAVSNPNDAWTTTETNVEFHTEAAQLFKGQGYQMWFPDEESTVRVKLTVDTDAGLDLDLLGDATLTGRGTELTNQWSGQPDGGHADLNVTTNILFDAYVDFGSFVWSNRVWGDSYTWSGASDFASLLIAGGPMLANVSILPENFVDEYFEVALTDELDFTFDGRIAPNCSTYLTGENIVTNGASVSFHGEEAVIPTPDDNEGTMPMDAQWRGKATSTFGLDITLEVGACYDTWGCISTGDFLTYPWMLQQGEVNVLGTAHFTHDLPAVDVRTNTVNLGEVEVGDSTSVDIKVADLGKVVLVGEVTVEGDGFEVVNGDFSADYSEDAVITVVFAPEDEGSSTGTLTIHTNDPVRPEVVVPVRGEGYVPEPTIDDGADDGEDTSGDVALDGGDEAKGRCGCSNQPTSVSGVVGLLGLALVVARRKRS